jgi:hypothetical protein
MSTEGTPAPEAPAEAPATLPPPHPAGRPDGRPIEPTIASTALLLGALVARAVVDGVRGAGVWALGAAALAAAAVGASLLPRAYLLSVFGGALLAVYMITRRQAAAAASVWQTLHALTLAAGALALLQPWTWAAAGTTAMQFTVVAPSFIDWRSWTAQSSAAIRAARCLPVLDGDTTTGGAVNATFDELRDALCAIISHGQPFAVGAHVGVSTCALALGDDNECLFVLSPVIERARGGRVNGNVNSPFCPGVSRAVTLDASVVLRGRDVRARTLTGAAAAAAQLAEQQLRGRSICDEG